MITAIGVVVPAHDEELVLESCLAALQAAVRSVGPVPVRICVVADACTDRTAGVAQAAGTEVISIAERNVGAARAAGMAAILSTLKQHLPDRIWLATTDADTTVPSWWLTAQLAYAATGSDAVVGTVTVSDWTGHPPHVPAAFAAHYSTPDGPHPHVHGANFGCRASAYLRAGGFRALPAAEDHDLLQRLIGTGCAIARSKNIPVTTSSRRHGRAPAGFSQFLTVLGAAPDAGQLPFPPLRPPEGAPHSRGQ